MNVTTNNDQTDLEINLMALPDVVSETLRLEGVKADEVSINFVDEETICALHGRFFNDPSFTDCISLPLNNNSSDYVLLGEIFVCPLAAVGYTMESGGDPYEEVLLYVIHGLLHLMGYDDIEDEESRKMRQAERRHLENLKSLKLSLSIYNS
ncbi:MAG: Endoribonuclease YbeY [Chlamydiae bacterium]|nr:Endoribonuclease YbeY [Chlamydiota bacterium]